MDARAALTSDLAVESGILERCWTSGIIGILEGLGSWINVTKFNVKTEGELTANIDKRSTKYITRPQ